MITKNPELENLKKVSKARYMRIPFCFRQCVIVALSNTVKRVSIIKPDSFEFEMDKIYSKFLNWEKELHDVECWHRLITPVGRGGNLFCTCKDFLELDSINNNLQG